MAPAGDVRGYSTEHSRMPVFHVEMFGVEGIAALASGLAKPFRRYMCPPPR